MQDWLQITLRTLMAVAAVFTFTKLLGKRQVTQLSLFEYITGITIGSLVAYISLDLEAEWYLGLVAMAVWVGVSLIIELLQLKSKKFRSFIDGKATVLIEHGNIVERNLRKERISADELMEKLRSKDVFRVADVEFALMEPGGEINVLLTEGKQPLSLGSLGMQSDSKTGGEPQVVVMDGQLMDEGLRASGKDRTWLTDRLQAEGVEMESVFLAQVDAHGKLQVDLYDDRRPLTDTQPTAVESVLRALRQCEAELRRLASTANHDAKRSAFTACVDQLSQIIRQVKPLDGQ